jgi:type IV pilus assembly protein PilP
VVLPPTDVLTELQQWELDQLRVVGILRKNGDRVALIEDPRGKGHIVEAGAFVGTRWGRIERIADAEVVVAETYTDDYGRILPIEVSMRLPDAYPEG